MAPKKAKGAPAKVPADLADEVKRWLLEGPAKQGLDRANGTYAELAGHLLKAKGVRASRSAVGRFCRKLGVGVDRPTYRYLRGDPAKQAAAREELAGLKKAEAGGLVLLSQDEARSPMVPALAATLGVKGTRPVVGTWGNKGLPYVLAVLNVVTAAAHANTLECPKDAKRKTGKSKNRRLTEAFAAHLRHVGRVYPGEQSRRVVLVLDNAPWHAGEAADGALRESPHLGFKRLPAYSPSLNPVERFWRVLRRRATHNRLFDTLADLRRSVRHSLSYFQTVRARVVSLVEKSFRRKATASVAP